MRATKIIHSNLDQKSPVFRNSLRSNLKQFGVGLWRSFCTPPTNQILTWAAITSLFGLAALGIGFGAGLYNVELLDLKRYWYIPILLLVFPSIPEELFFRGMMMPRNVVDRPWPHWVFYSIFSATLFTLSRPLYAITVDPDANPLFLDLNFLLIVYLLGLTCSLGYIVSRSIWVPVIIHWLTALIWLLFLGGGRFLPT